MKNPVKLSVQPELAMSMCSMCPVIVIMEPENIATSALQTSTGSRYPTES